MFEPFSFLRSVAFAVLFAGIEYRYVNRREEEWTRKVESFYEKAAFWIISPYQAYLLLPTFVVVAFALPVSAWAGNTFLVAVAEDMAYFAWRGSRVVKGEWTTMLFGSFTVNGHEVSVWWPLGLLIAAALYLMPL
ncbi:MAG: hypothetical protein LYZ69_08625 [Nitrososphaerales archaeon]|nr:hypothetical protein [Nitrososphaerales archaeon]